VVHHRESNLIRGEAAISLSLGPSDRDDGIDSGVAEVLHSLEARSVSFRIEAQGSRWEPLQALRPEGPPLRPSDFTIVAIHDPARDRMRLSWQRTFLEPLTATVDFDEIVVGNKGYITGSDIALAPKPARPMESDRLAAVRRQQYLLNPQLLVGDALHRQHDTGEQVIRYVGRQELNGAPHGVVEIDALPRPIRLFVALDSNEVSLLVTQENDFPCGDVEIAVTFSDWRRDSGLAFPYQVELSWEGTVIHRETRRRIEVNPQLEPDTFVLSETLPFDHRLAERGMINAQWIHRALAMGAPIILDAGEVVPVQISPDVVTIGGGIHHSLAIALDSGVVVVDPPQHEERSLAVIKAVTGQWPDKPITHLILTHHHHDHSGGIRAYAAIGAELIMAQGDRDFIARCLERPHTISPDTLAAKATKPTIRTVGDDGLSLGGGEIQVYRISSPHSAEDLVVYVASVKLLFNADLFNPGLVKQGAAAPPHWLKYSRDFRKQIEALNLDIEVLLGAHGVPEGGPYQELIDFTK
jgi:glyoxylase-like metal-dependent hydrolase (beta-lactamase superfamily II)